MNTHSDSWTFKLLMSFFTKLCAVFFLFPGLQTFWGLTLRSLLFRDFDFDVIQADEPALSMFWHPNPRSFAPKEKKETKYAIYFFYVHWTQLYSAFWTENPKRFQKCENGYVACLSSIELTRNFTWLPAVTYTRKWCNMERQQPFLSQPRKGARNQGLA
jgi:hypothetical protein